MPWGKLPSITLAPRLVAPAGGCVNAILITSNRRGVMAIADPPAKIRPRIFGTTSITGLAIPNDRSASTPSRGSNVAGSPNLTLFAMFYLIWVYLVLFVRSALIWTSHVYLKCFVRSGHYLILFLFVRGVVLFARFDQIWDAGRQRGRVYLGHVAQPALFLLFFNVAGAVR